VDQHAGSVQQDFIITFLQPLASLHVRCAQQEPSLQWRVHRAVKPVLLVNAPFRTCQCLEFMNDSICQKMIQAVTKMIQSVKNAHVNVWCFWVIQSVKKAGTYSVGGSSSCTPCSAGTFSNRSGIVSETFCIPCPVNTYSSTSAANSSTLCLKCPTGTGTLLRTGASSLEQCLDACGGGRCFV
jgi:hypothetical protein